MPNIDLFQIFRWLLATICTVYTLVYSWQTLIGWLNYFNSSRYGMMMGRYTAILLLRIRFRRFAWDLLHIVALVGLFFYIVYLHHHFVPVG